MYQENLYNSLMPDSTPYILRFVVETPPIVFWSDFDKISSGCYSSSFLVLRNYSFLCVFFPKNLIPAFCEFLWIHMNLLLVL
jgi:hypothetical protein